MIRFLIIQPRSNANAIAVIGVELIIRIANNDISSAASDSRHFNICKRYHKLAVVVGGHNRNFDSCVFVATYIEIALEAFLYSALCEFRFVDI